MEDFLCSFVKTAGIWEYVCIENGLLKAHVPYCMFRLLENWSKNKYLLFFFFCQAHNGGYFYSSWNYWSLNRKILFLQNNINNNNNRETINEKWKINKKSFHISGLKLSFFLLFFTCFLKRLPKYISKHKNKKN